MVQILFSVAIKVLLSKYSLNPGSMVPIGTNIKKPVTRTLIGKQIKYKYFGNKPMTAQDVKALTVSWFWNCIHVII